ncbi:hypothetical protein RJ639_046141, partial [Escallonia herrerae]
MDASFVPLDVVMPDDMPHSTIQFSIGKIKQGSHSDGGQDYWNLAEAASQVLDLCFYAYVTTAVIDILPPPYSAIDDSLYDGHPPSAPKLQKLRLAFDLGNPIANGGPFSGEYSTPINLQFSYKTIRVATDKFSLTRRVGIHALGPVYKGILPNGQEIAVESLSMKNKQAVWQLVSEIELFAKVQHRNLVRLLGFCIGTDEVLLIYEFLPNPSAWICWQNGTCLDLVDPILKADTSSMQEIMRCIHIGLLCVEYLAADRPSMAAVDRMLGRPSITLPTLRSVQTSKH